MNLPPLLRILLWPLSQVYGIYVRCRYRLYARDGVSLAAKCNGNQRGEFDCRRNRQDSYGLVARRKILN